MKLVKSLATLFLLVGLLSGCGGKIVKNAVIATEGVTIRAVDDSFMWRSGETINPPKSLQESWSKKDIPDASNPCEKCTKVRVAVPGRSTELYGRIKFYKMHKKASGPGSRLYYIQIPQSYVDEAEGGRISVVYELVEVGGRTKQAGWVLWLSDRPF